MSTTKQTNYDCKFKLSRCVSTVTKTRASYIESSLLKIVSIYAQYLNSCKPNLAIIFCLSKLNIYK